MIKWVYQINKFNDRLNMMLTVLNWSSLLTHSCRTVCSGKFGPCCCYEQTWPMFHLSTHVPMTSVPGGQIWGAIGSRIFGQSYCSDSWDFWVFGHRNFRTSRRAKNVICGNHNTRKFSCTFSPNRSFLGTQATSRAPTWTGDRYCILVPFHGMIWS